MYHQKVKEIKYDIISDYKPLPNYTEQQSIVIQKIGQFIYQTDNIYLATNVRKLWENSNQTDLNKYIQALQELHQKNLLDLKLLPNHEIYSSVIISPELMIIFYKNYLQGYDVVTKNLKIEIIEKENIDSFKIAQNIGVKLVVVNNILDYLRIKDIVKLMRYSGTPLPGGKSFIILQVDKQKLQDFEF